MNHSLVGLKFAEYQYWLTQKLQQVMQAHPQGFVLIADANDFVNGGGCAARIFLASLWEMPLETFIFWISNSFLKTGHCLDNAEWLESFRPALTQFEQLGVLIQFSWNLSPHRAHNFSALHHFLEWPYLRHMLQRMGFGTYCDTLVREYPMVMCVGKTRVSKVSTYMPESSNSSLPVFLFFWW